MDFKHIKESIYGELDGQADQTERDRRWLIKTSRIWATPVIDLRHKYDEDDDALSEHDERDPSNGTKLSDNRLRWYPTAVAIAEYLHDTWASLPGSKTTIHHDTPLRFP